MNNVLQSSLEQCLRFAKVSVLPQEYDGNNYWIFAIVLLQKADMSKNYAIAENDGYGRANVVKDFGHSARIAQVLEIRPFLIAGDEILPDLRSRAHIRNFLRSNNMDDEVAESLFSKKHEDGTPKSEDEIKNDNEKIFGIVLKIAIRSRIHSYYVNYLYNEGDATEQTE